MTPFAEPYDIAEYLDNDEMISAYLTEAFEADDPHEAIQALGDVARARGGMERLARISNIAVGDLQSALSQSGEPQYATVHKVLRALGVKLSVSVTRQESLAA